MIGKRIMVTEFRLDKFKDRPEEAPLTKRQEQERFKKYGRLTVLRLHLKKKGQAQQVDCLCECGRIVTKTWYDVKQGKEPRNCGNPDCLWSRIDAEKNIATTPAIILRLKPKWRCRRPDAGCARSELCGICCAECDRQSRCEMACRNNPAACGGSERREKRY